MKCPICSSERRTSILNLLCGNLDKSSLYPRVKLYVCESCGHLYNHLFDHEIHGLTLYYKEEYAPINLSSIDKVGDRPGSSNQFSLERYNQMFNLFPSYLGKDSRILDVGCGIGGFLDFLNKKGFKNTYGIEVIKEYVDYANSKYDYNIEKGNVYWLPYNSKSFDIVILDQVLEHLVDLKSAIIEIKRVLVDGGLLCIGVPDASKYTETSFFDFYWFLLREHIQHFDLEHLKLLIEPQGFELVKFVKTETPMLSEKAVLPNLNALFYLNNKRRYFRLIDKTEQYLNDQFVKLHQKKEMFIDLAKSQKPVYVWGTGREFLYLYESVGLKKCNIVGLIDDYTYKQERFTVDGMKIRDSSILKEASADSVLIITAIAHIDLIKDKITDYCGEIIDV